MFVNEWRLICIFRPIVMEMTSKGMLDWLEGRFLHIMPRKIFQRHNPPSFLSGNRLCVAISISLSTLAMCLRQENC